MKLAGNLAAVAEAEAELLSKGLLLLLTWRGTFVRGAGAMASTKFLAEVRLRFLFELEPDRGLSDSVIVGNGLAKSGAVAGNLPKVRLS